MPTECKIIFDNNVDRVFYGNQLLTGHVELKLVERKTVRGIFVQITGDAYCRWTEGTNDNKRTYTGNESYLNEKTFLIGGRDDELLIQPGDYRYSFHCNLPVGLPTSLEADTGYIRYKVKIVLDIPLWPDQEYETIFTVIRPLNLNYDATLRLPVLVERYKTFYPCCLFCCCSSDPMHVVVRIPVSGYTPGQAINIEVDSDNKSNSEAEFTVQLIKKITFYTHANSAKSKVETITVCEKEQIGRSSISSVELFRTVMIIPPIPPTDEMSSNICKVKYILRVIGAVAGCHNDAIVDIPITIGSYPILDSQNMQSFPSQNGSNRYIFSAISSDSQPAVIVEQPIATPTNILTVPASTLNNTIGGPMPTAAAEAHPITSSPYPNTVSALPNPSSPFPYDDPPTYEQATKGNEIDGKFFKPNYPMYRRSTSYSSPSSQ